jgi:hypothetical protein
MKILLLIGLLLIFGCSPSSFQASLSSISSPHSPQDGQVPPVSGEKSEVTMKITELARTSACASTNWVNRGKAPAGYIKGVALSYARSLCRIQSVRVQAAAKILDSKASGITKDILTHYQDLLSVVGLLTNRSGESALRATYTVGIGLGMRESSGKYCVGWDTSAGANRPSSAAEAGVFQVSYDSIGASDELQKLYTEYKANPDRCQLDVFKEGVQCKDTPILGNGAGADFQIFIKKCPAFATEYAMTLTRILRNHFGPLNRKEAQVLLSCESLFSKVSQLVNADPESTCAELF